MLTLFLLLSCGARASAPADNSAAKPQAIKQEPTGYLRGEVDGRSLSIVYDGIDARLGGVRWRIRGDGKVERQAVRSDPPPASDLTRADVRDLVRILIQEQAWVQQGDPSKLEGAVAHLRIRIGRLESDIVESQSASPEGPALQVRDWVEGWMDWPKALFLRRQGERLGVWGRFWLSLGVAAVTFCLMPPASRRRSNIDSPFVRFFLCGLLIANCCLFAFLLISGHIGASIGALCFLGPFIAYFALAALYNFLGEVSSTTVGRDTEFLPFRVKTTTRYRVITGIDALLVGHRRMSRVLVLVQVANLYLLASYLWLAQS
ncbi:MAG: hypothetical protein ABSH46_11340 [Bryobacteraceae bacterium]